MAAAAILKNTQKGISQPVLDRFKPNLVLLIDTGNTSVINGPKCHFLKNRDGGVRHFGKYTKGRIWANS